MSLIFDIAWTHVRARVRQTGFAVAGVATGVGFSIMMASLMQGSQEDFTRRLVNTLPHITVSDERRAPPPQPADAIYPAAEMHGLTPEARRPGIKNPLASMAALEGWLPGAIAPSVKVQAIIRYANHDVGTSVHKRALTVGLRGTREVEVVDGLQEGERVASPALPVLKDGKRVRVAAP